MLQGSGQHNQTSRSHLSDAENEEVEVLCEYYISHLLLLHRLLYLLLTLFAFLSQKFLNPTNNRNGASTNNGTNTPIELQVTNLDQNIDTKDMKRILSAIFMEHVSVNIIV